MVGLRRLLVRVATAFAVGVVFGYACSARGHSSWGATASAAPPSSTLRPARHGSSLRAAKLTHRRSAGSAGTRGAFRSIDPATDDADQVPLPPGFEVSSGSRVDYAALDPSVSPCDDFYQYACGGWLAHARIPAVYSIWDGRMAARRASEERLRRILEADAAGEPDPADPYAAQAGDLYAACMNAPRIEARGAAPLRAELAPLAAIHDVQSLEKALAHYHEQGFDLVFDLRPEIAPDDATQMIAALNQGELGLPDASYYLDGSADSQAVLASYRRYAVRMLELSGLAPADASANIDAVLTLETRLAEAMASDTDAADPADSYHRLTLGELEQLAPGFPWRDYFTDMGFDPDAVSQLLDVKAPSYFAGLAGILADTAPATWRAYLRLRVASDTALDLPRAFLKQRFVLTHALSGERLAQRRWEHCVQVVDKGIGMAPARTYVAQALSPAARALATDTIRTVEDQMRIDLDGLGWMDDPTRQAALAKLAAIQNQVGYPDVWPSYEGLTLDPDELYEDQIAVATFRRRRALATIGKPTPHSDWMETPPTVNAYFRTSMNEMVIPAGMLQPPYFAKGADEADNFGGIGEILAHELTHGFDNKGSQFDAHAELRNWWTDASAAEFARRSDCLVKQYSRYQLAGVHVNGELTLGENIADNGGVKLAFAAFEAQEASESTAAPASQEDAADDGGDRSGGGDPIGEVSTSDDPSQRAGRGDDASFTPEQEFFVAFAQVWCQAQYDEQARLGVRVNPHSPYRFRVDGSLSNLPAFQTAFACQDGAPMAPVKRCQIW
jgi:endothelin-converting enzyme/putative endopeptidase